MKRKLNCSQLLNAIKTVFKKGKITFTYFFLNFRLLLVKKTFGKKYIINVLLKYMKGGILKNSKNQVLLK